jgi:hypothetical protein
MKKTTLGLLVGLGLAGSARAATTPTCGGVDTPRTLAFVCNRINDANITIRCFAAGQNAFLDPCALGECDTFTDSNATVNCIASIANREFTDDEIVACHRITDANLTSQCLAAAGTTHLGLDKQNLFNQVFQALSDLRAGNAFAAETILQQLLTDLSTP